METNSLIGNDGSIRSFSISIDKQTGQDWVFAGALPSGIKSGVNDSTLSGKILWDTGVDLIGFVG